MKAQMNTSVCTQCGTVGKTKTVTKGSLDIELILWLVFLVPGLVYSAWRLASRHKACGSCGSTSLVPPQSPVGQSICRQHLSEVPRVAAEYNSTPGFVQLGDRARRLIVRLAKWGMGLGIAALAVSTLIAFLIPSEDETQQAWQKNLTPEQEERLAAITAHKEKAKLRVGQEANHSKALPRVNAGIELMNDGFLLQNHDSYDWGPTTIYIDGLLFGYKHKLPEVKRGEVVPMVLRDFVTRSGKRFDSFSRRPTEIVVSVEGHDSPVWRPQ